MTNFDDELEILVLKWLARGADPKSIREALLDQVEKTEEMMRICT